MSTSFHLFLPQMRMTHEAIVERALAAEAAGFEGISFMDHLAPPMALEHDMWEAMSIAAWVLARTSTLKVSHLVLCDSLRHPAVLARQVTSLDHASGGRFELGIGWGSVPEELEVYGVGSTAPRVRVGRLAETLEVLRLLWTGEEVDFEGEHVTLRGARQRPVPTGPIPITIGGVGKRTLALVREHARWWNLPIHELDRLDELRGQVGDAGVSIQSMVALVPEDAAARDDFVNAVRRRFGRGAMGRNLAIGDADELAAHFRGLAERGVERFHVWFADFAPPETLRRFADVLGRV